MKIPKPVNVFSIVILSVGLIWFSGVTAADTSVALDMVTVDLWPELDQPGVTIFYEIRLAEDATSSQDINLRIPATADVLLIQNGDENPLIWELTTEGQWQNLSFNTLGAVTYLTLYDPRVVKQNQTRSYSFQWFSTNPVNTLSFTIQIPYGAGDLITEPQMTLADTCSKNCTYYTLNTHNVAAGEPFPISFQYEKDLSNPNYSARSVRASENIDEFTIGRTASPLSVVLWLVAVALVLTILVGLYYWWFRRRLVEHQTRPVRGVGIDNPEKQAIFCHECGSRSRTGDTFCRNCGTELRRFN